MKEIEIPIASTDKYEEALAKARFEYKENPCASESEKRLLEIIFPELKEDKQEVIIKRIKLCLEESVHAGTIRDYEAEEAVAWIEKHKEQKPAEWSEDFQENIRILLHNKLTWHSDDGKMSSAVLIDDKTLKDIISGIWFYVGKEALKYPNKELSQPEWSEEDEKMKQRILTHLYSFIYPNSLYAEDASECISWLKSLRPQPRWKPSEEQMKIFNEAIEHYSKYWDSEDIKILCSLYDELSKL